VFVYFVLKLQYFTTLSLMSISYWFLPCL